MSYTGNLYELLEISPTASREDIKKAYKRKAKLYHPDVNRQANAHVHFLLIQQAYQTLIDPHARLLYDQKLSSGQSYILTYAEWKKLEEEKYRAQIEEEERLFQEKRRRFQQRNDILLLHIGLYIILVLSFILGASILIGVVYILIVYHWILLFTLIPMLGLSIFLFKYTFQWFKKSKRFF
jgi:hypothetical protein